MKTNILSDCRRSLRGAAAIAALLVLGGLTPVAQGQNSPVGPTWDCLLSGSGQQGIAFLTFSNPSITAYEIYTNVTVIVTNFDETFTTNFLTITNTAYETNGRTFTGYQILVGKQNAASSDSSSSIGADSRGVFGDVGRGVDLGTGAPATGGGNPVFGISDVSGPWDYDDKGRVVGYFVQVLDQQTTITTNEVYQIITGTQVVVDTNTVPPTTWETNVYVTITNVTYTTHVTGITNPISFSAKVVPGKRLTLTSSTPYGKVTYRGVPQKPPGAVISGRWQGNKKANNQNFLELFNLLPTDVPNIYFTTNGQGPNMSFFGWAMVSTQKKIGFAFETFSGVVTNFDNVSGGTLSATYGPISYTKKGTKANTKGMEEPSNPISFQAVRQSL